MGIVRVKVIKIVRCWHAMLMWAYKYKNYEWSEILQGNTPKRFYSLHLSVIHVQKLIFCDSQLGCVTLRWVEESHSFPGGRNLESLTGDACPELTSSSSVKPALTRWCNLCWTSNFPFRGIFQHFLFGSHFNWIWIRKEKKCKTVLLWDFFSNK